MQHRIAGLLVLAGLMYLALGAMPARAGAMRPYADPDGAFAISIPDDWQAKRNPMEKEIGLTELQQPAGAAKIVVLVVPLTAVKVQKTIDAVGEMLTTLALESIRAQGMLLAADRARALFNNCEIVRCDVRFRPQEGAERKGFTLAMLGKKRALLITASGTADDPVLQKQLSAYVSSFAPESRTPGEIFAPIDQAYGASGLDRLAQTFKGQLARTPAEAVLVDGTPAYTCGDLANFAVLLSRTCGIELTEAEFALMQQRSVEAFTAGNADVRLLLTQGWTRMLQQLEQVLPDQREAVASDLRVLLLDRFDQATKAGIPWAQTLQEIIDRRATVAIESSADKPEFAARPGFDAAVSDADLDAALEMLLFLWVASGRDTKAVTTEGIAAVRGRLVQQYAQFSPQMQYTLANAQPIYAALRGAWLHADTKARTRLTTAFTANLNALGFTPATAWTAWDAKSRGELIGTLAAEMLKNGQENVWVKP